MDDNLVQTAEIATEVTAKFRVVTPMFLGGVQQIAEGFRPPSFKSALRFWWRALNWSRIRQTEACPDDVSALKELHTQEAHLFGMAAREEKNITLGGQGIFLLATVATNLQQAKLVIAPFLEHAYLLGMGLYNEKTLKRNALEGEFDVVLRFRSNSTQQERHSIIEALQVLGSLGGLGSRSRHGWGSLALLSIKGAGYSIPSNRMAYQNYISNLLGVKNTAEPPYTAISSFTKVVFTQKTNQDPWSLLGVIGKELALYRSWGRRGDTDSCHQVFKLKAEQNFRTDHDEMEKASKNLDPKTLPERLVFGIPHNYFFSRSKGKVDIQLTKGGLERRSSPLFIHIHPLDNGEYVGVVFLLRSRFLPEHDLVTVSNVTKNKDSRKQGQTWNLPMDPAWHRIDEFMNRSIFSPGVGK